MIFKTVFISFISGLLFWLCLNANLQLYVLITGTLVSALLAAFFYKIAVFGDLRLTPKSIIAMFTWLVIFIVELVKSNIDVFFRVISPTLRINPGIVEVKTTLKSPLGRLLLANSITLTPGTLTVDIKDDILFIHWIDVTSSDIEGATKAIARKFEKPLEVIFD
ncbi:MAG: Na+/H+ antiporter subunit E [Deltaproteobacteria bacterium]|nr:Na+/H+ antiporter subunit E [Deltaproteobacteria bacterium]